MLNPLLNRIPVPLCLDDFDYELPAQLIAQVPLPERSASRLLQVSGDYLSHHAFSDLPGFLEAGDLLVFNDTKVLHARLLGQKESGGQVEVLVERAMTGKEGDEVLAQVRASKSPKPGSWLRLEEKINVEVLGREGEFFRLRFAGDALDLIERHGRLPLPPYIDRGVADADESRYQTIYARAKGSVAAPTAGLHFDAELLARLRQRGVSSAYVTLHVGAGTFQPVRVQNLSEHRMHTERYEIPAATADAIAATRERGGRVVAVGTTSLRALESAAQSSVQSAEKSSTGDVTLKVGAGETALFITPGYSFRVVDLLISNFHLPKSTLLMLVSAFGGLDELRAAYQVAIANGYRFFSYGDAMLLHRKPAL